jgi:catechol 2,3-dioxygenase-like lactoylglutathione lyase family enzyme
MVSVWARQDQVRRFADTLVQSMRLRRSAAIGSAYRQYDRIQGHPAVSVTKSQVNFSVDNARASKVDMKFEVVVIPVSDVDVAKRFYAALGWRLDIDFAASKQYRVVQFTPPGSACSIIFGIGITAAVPGSAQGLYLIVSDIEAARADLIGRGVTVSEPFYDTGGIFHHQNGEGIAGGLHPQRRSYGTYASFSDPDGNGWFFQEVTARLPGHELSSDIEFTSSTELARALRRAAAAHDLHERGTGKQDALWADWYADYISAEQGGRPVPAG